MTFTLQGKGPVRNPDGPFFGSEPGVCRGVPRMAYSVGSTRLRSSSA